MSVTKEEMESYNALDLKQPVENPKYRSYSESIVALIEGIMKDAMDTGRNKIVIDTNLKLGIPMENVNKIAGPFIEAWAYEVFSECLNDGVNSYKLVNVEAGERLNMADIVLQFRIGDAKQEVITSNVDVKATSNDIEDSGRAPNITSYSRIRTAYIENPDYIFIILSIKHSVYSTRDEDTKMMKGVMEVVAFNAYDLKFLSEGDLSYNPALGTGQIQVRDIHYVELTPRTTWEFCQLLDKKFLHSKKGYAQWLLYAKQNKWIKE